MKEIIMVENLSVHYLTQKGIAKAVDGVFFDLKENECVGLVGESGCGKTTLAKALMRILPENGKIEEGRILLKGFDILQMTEAEFRSLRWKEISIVPQSAMNSLDPVRRIGEQIVEAFQTHDSAISYQLAMSRTEELFTLVGLEKGRLKDYPHQFSGGMRQRAMIAMALVLDPTLIIADEPTTGLDVIVQDQILYKIREIRAAKRKAMILVTHDIAIVAENCHRIMVMYAGKIVESGKIEEVFDYPSHPYTMGLLNAFPNIKSEKEELVSIPGSPPSLIDLPPGCRFHLRCPFARDICTFAEPPLFFVKEDHLCACLREIAQSVLTWQRASRK
jgi:peptide/nickel transport system ATP-binding protein